MTMLRRRLRVIALTWLVFQVSWVIALVPRDCCAGHRPVKQSCHESTATHADCRLTGSCEGPMSTLFALLSNQGILPDATAAAPNVAVRRVATTGNDDVIGRFHPPDPPPPRA